MDGLVPCIQAKEFMDVPPGTSIERLCELLIACEKAQRRCQWASGFLLLNLMQGDEAPKKPSAFASWLAQKTGMKLTQGEIVRRVAVFKFYSAFADDQIIELIESSGIRAAFHARKAIDPKRPELARAVLQACVARPTDMDETLRQFGQPPSKKKPSPIIRIKRSTLQALRDEITASPKHFGGKDWVPLSKVLEMLDRIEQAEDTIP